MSSGLQPSAMCIVKKCNQRRYYMLPNDKFVIKILHFRFPVDKVK